MEKMLKLNCPKCDNEINIYKDTTTNIIWSWYIFESNL